MAARLANLGPERRPFGGPKMADSSGYLRLEATWTVLSIMLACLAWLLGPKWKTPLEIEGGAGLRASPACQQVSEPGPLGGEGEGINPLPGTRRLGIYETTC